MAPSTDNWIIPFISQGHKCWLSCVHVRHSCVCRVNESLLVRWSFRTYAAWLKKQIQHMKIRAQGKLKGRGWRRRRWSSVSLLRVQKHNRLQEVSRGGPRSRPDRGPVQTNPEAQKNQARVQKKMALNAQRRRRQEGRNEDWCGDTIEGQRRRAKYIREGR